MKEKMTIYEKLSQVQIELKAPKNQTNAFGKYRYRNCEDILEAAKPLLNKHRLALTISDNIKVIGTHNPITYTDTYYDKDLKRENTRTVVTCGERYYIEAIAMLFDFDSKETICSTALAREEETKKGMDEAQITGAASSYARKYALNGLFNIDDTKDADAQEPTKGSKKVEPAEEQFDMMIQEGQKQMINGRIKKEALDKILEKYQVKSIDELNWNQANAIETLINAKLKKENKTKEEVF